MSDTATPTPSQVPNTHPKGLYFFFWGEFAERFTYYGMRTILFLYMTQVLRFADTEAGPIYTIFKQACYFLPLLGGYIADRWLGRYWTIVGFSVPYVIGQFLLGVPNPMIMYLSLALLACGSGVIKPNISPLMGQTYDQQRPGNDRLRVSAFNLFYLAINIGALISTFSLPLIRTHYIRTHLDPAVQAQALAAEKAGEDIAKYATQEVLQNAYQVAFQFPAWFMLASLLIFAAGKRSYAVERPERHDLTPEERRLQWATLKRLFGIFALVVLFWFGYEHNDTLWVAFSRDYVDLRVPLFGWPISADQLQFLNSLFVIILIPVFNVLFSRIDPDIKIFTPMRKVLAGFILTAAAIGIMAVAGFIAQGHTEQVWKGVKEETIVSGLGQGTSLSNPWEAALMINTTATGGGKLEEVSTVKVSALWPALAYIILTFGEVLLYGTMLELAYSAAPKSMKGFVTACFLVTNTLGNFLNMFWMTQYGGSLVDPVAKRGPLLPGQFFGITALVVAGAAVAFIFVGRQFERARAETTTVGVP
jgi:POT family proton-dependent oligopeptide transporter